MADQLIVTLDGIRVDVDEIPAESFITALRVNEVAEHVESMLSLAAKHLSGEQTAYEQPTNWIHSLGSLPLYPISSGCLAAQWTFEPPPAARSDAESVEIRAIDTLLKQGGQDASECINPMRDYLRNISEADPETLVWLGDAEVWLGDADDTRRVRVSLAEGVGFNREPSDDDTLLPDLHAIGLRCAALLRPGPSAVEHGDFLYDELGLPK